jgi:hypothetical protein
MPFFEAFRIAIEITKELLLLDGKGRFIALLPQYYIEVISRR